MNHIKKTFRQWWMPPRKASVPEQDRSVSFLELFYDLSYVVIIAQLAHSLVGHLTLGNFIGFICLYTLVWLAWVNGSYYHENHGNNDIRTRVFTFLQMIALAGMAIFAHSAIGDGAQGFALSFSAFLLIITYLWWRTGVYDPEHASMSDPYAIGYVFTTIIFFISAFVDQPINYYLWGIGTVFSVLLPLLLSLFNRRVDPEHREAAQSIQPSLVERFGLLNIIVLGEVIVAVVGGTSHAYDITFWLAVQAIFGMLIAVGMWWIYFDYISHRMPMQTNGKRMAWIYLHLPLTMSITLAGVGIITLLESKALTTPETWMLVIPVSVFLVTVSLMMKTLNIRREIQCMYQQGSYVILGSAVGLLILGLLEPSKTMLMIAVSILLLVPVYSGISMWTYRLYTRQLEQQS